MHELLQELEALEQDLGPVMAKAIKPRLDRIRKLADQGPRADLGQVAQKAQEILDLLKLEGKEKKASPQPKRAGKVAVTA
ncbi:MAG TPA: hypothetical protein V6D05_01180 [Stenomitos sp.]